MGQTLKVGKRHARKTRLSTGRAFVSLFLLPFTCFAGPFAAAQFTSTTTTPALAPVSQAFTDGFMQGRQIMIANMGAGHSSISKPRANTGKGDLGDASKDLRDVSKFVDDNWGKADDSARGKVAGEVETTVQYDQSYAMQLSQNTGVAILNHTTEAGYLSGPGRINGTKEHLLKLLTDTADQLDTLNGGIAGNPAKKTGVTGALTNDDSHAAAFIPFYNAVHMGNRGKHESEKATIVTNNQFASSVKAISDNLANIMMPSSSAQR